MKEIRTVFELSHGRFQVIRNVEDRINEADSIQFRIVDDTGHLNVWNISGYIPSYGKQSDLDKLISFLQTLNTAIKQEAKQDEQI